MNSNASSSKSGSASVSTGNAVDFKDESQSEAVASLDRLSESLNFLNIEPAELEATIRSININELPVELFVNQIFSFVGPCQFRTVGAVCRSFNDAYRKRFPKITSRYKTRYNMSSMKYAKICWEEAPLSDRWLLHDLAREQCWYFYVRLDDLNEDDRALVQWTLATYGCSFEIKKGVFNSFMGFRTCDVATQHGNLEMLQWARSIGYDWQSTCITAALHGQLEILQWAISNGCPLHPKTCSLAAENGHLELLQWALYRGCPVTTETCASAASGGHLGVLKWLRSNGCPWNEHTCSEAARMGHLKVLKWAHDNGCPFDKRTCTYAAEKGHLEVLQWAHANRCPWDETTCEEAAYYGHFEVLK